MAKKRIHHILIGFVGESLVQAYAILSSGGMLGGFRPAADIDHKDWIIDQRGGFRNAYIQIKCVTGLVHRRVQCLVRFDPKAIPSDARFAYVFCLLDVEQMDFTKIWVVPSADFNRLAYRSLESGGKLDLVFSCRVDGDPKWDKYEVDKHTLGPRLLEFVKAPAKRKAPKGIDLGSVLLLRGTAKPSRAAA